MAKTIIRLIVFLIPVIVCGTASARIGETKKECEKRYGKAVRELSDTAVMFLKNGFYVTVIFRDGKAGAVKYQRTAAAVVVLGEKLTDDEINTFLEVNASGKKWLDKIRLSEMEMDIWYTEDESLRAVYMKDHRLVVITKECIDTLNDGIKREIKEMLEGF